MAKPPRALAHAKSSSPAAGPKSLSLAQAQARAQKSPDDAIAWREIGRHQLAANKLDEAHSALEKALGLAPEAAPTWMLLGQVELRRNNVDAAAKLLQRSVKLDDGNAEAHFHLATALQRASAPYDSLRHIEKARELGLNDSAVLSLHTTILLQAHHQQEAIDLLKQQLKADPANAHSYNINLGNAYRDVGRLAESEDCYLKAARLNPASHIAGANHISLLHYMPEKTPEQIRDASLEFGTRFTPRKPVKRAQAADKSPDRVLRVGMFSDGFRQHPVGAMTTPALEHLVNMGVELYLYSTTPAVDHITERLKAIATEWTVISSLDDEQFAQRVRDDEIDILFDLAGHGSGTRIPTLTREPAPLIVKWVGMLINTTGIKSIDYLLSDSIESPPGSDDFYSEKLIRMPDDYICYLPPARFPALAAPPALKNGYITFGCFNNPTKINPVVLVEWGKLLQMVPNSRLMLKSGPYTSPDMQKMVLETLAPLDIDAERVIFEGHSNHFKLFESYNQIDIALDPWPYSGGLTTCEAMLMGVPVVTLPGPTFAGRHSATHLVNAGMPELVVNDWNEYRARAVGLASDLNSLATIRQHLRKILLDSVVCDGAKFARHLADALRAIWQRYCEDKPPAALAFTPEGRPWFEDENQPRDIAPVDTPSTKGKEENAFSFSFKGKIITLDHGGILADTHTLATPAQMGTLTTIMFDPASRLQNIDALKQRGQLDHYQAHIALGDGEPGVLYTCLNADFSGTLEPLAQAKLLPMQRQPASVLARLPIGTTRLDTIDGLDKLDWLILGEAYDNKKIIQGAEGLLPDILVIHARVLFVDLFKKQTTFDSLKTLLGKYGFRLLRLTAHKHASYYADIPGAQNHPGSQLLSADAVFVPEDGRLKTLDDNQRLKLAFLARTAYGADDYAHHVLLRNGDEIASQYLAAQGYGAARVPARGPETPFPGLPAPTGKKRFIHVCMNNINIQPLIRFLADPAFAQDSEHFILIEKTPLMPGYNNDVSGNPNAFFFNVATEHQKVLPELMRDEVAAVFFHSIFFDWQKQFVRRVGPHKKAAWIMWGGDLYNPIKMNAPITDVVEHLHAICPLTDGDYKFYLEHYPQKPRWDFAYAGMSDLAGMEMPKRKEKQIFVGNSGDPSNNHVEILEALAKKRDISDYKIILPISYNLSPDYEAELVRKAKSLKLEKNITFLKKIIPVREYYEMLGQSEFCITAHQRQQALGNIIASLYFGTKTILRDNIVVNGKSARNPAWERITTEFGAEPVAFDKFLKYKRLSDVPGVDDASLIAQQEKILTANNLDTLKQTMKERFTEFAKQ